MSKTKKVTKAVIPAAGWGTRLLPATKAQPKEMLPVVDKPVIQYVAEEAFLSGITDILIIIAEGKEVLRAHFRHDEELEAFLSGKGKQDELEAIRSVNRLSNIHITYQHEQRGLGDAILCAKSFCANEPFAVLLGDTITQSGAPLLLQLIELFEKYDAPVVALETVALEAVHRYGIFAGEKEDARLFRATQLVEKPPRAEAPSNMAFAGRYVFPPDIFQYLEQTQPGVNNEIQLTDALRLMMRHRTVYGWLFEGERFDVGNKLDFIKTNIAFAMKDPALRDALKAWLSKMNLPS